MEYFAFRTKLKKILYLCIMNNKSFIDAEIDCAVVSKRVLYRAIQIR